MKRIVSLAAIVLTLTMALSLAACGEEPGTNENTENGQNQTSSNETGKTVDLAALRTQFVTDYSLTDVLEAYGVVRTVPAPGLFAKIHGCIVFRFSNFSHTVLSPLQAPHSFAVYDWCCLPPFRLAANRGMRPGGYATFWWQPTHAARAETACGLCRARRRKTSVAKLKAPKPSACRFRGNNLRPALSGRSKNKTMQPPAPGTRAVGCSFSAASENADFSRRVSRRTTPAWQKRRSKRCGLKARAEGTVCLQTRE